MKKMSQLFKSVLLLAALTGTTAQNTALADDGADDGVIVGDVSNTPCSSRTRGESVMGHQILKLTRNENGLSGEVKDCEVNCAYGNVKVICQENGQNLSIGIDEGTGDIVADCTCQINIYFTIFNALQDEYQLTFRGRDVGTISFKEHSVVEIDLETLEQANEEGFDYPVKAQGFWPYEITEYLYPDQDLSQSMEIYNYGDQQLHCAFRNYYLPCEYSKLDVQAELDKDGTLVVNVLTDGIPGQDCNRVANLNFDIVNTPLDSYHLRLDHTILTKDGEGAEKAHVFCLYEGDFTVSLHDSVSIPINDNNDYKAVISGITSQQLNGTNIVVPYYDLQGRRLNNRSQKSIYIQNGKKYIAK